MVTGYGSGDFKSPELNNELPKQALVPTVQAVPTVELTHLWLSRPKRYAARDP
jgi:hypothetical protein